jgi:hypothetical protein
MPLAVIWAVPPGVTPLEGDVEVEAAGVLGLPAPDELPPEALLPQAASNATAAAAPGAAHHRFRMSLSPFHQVDVAVPTPFKHG